MDRQPGRSLLPPCPSLQGHTSTNVTGWDRSQAPQGLRAGRPWPLPPQEEGRLHDEFQGQGWGELHRQGAPHTP